MTDFPDFTGVTRVSFDVKDIATLEVIVWRGDIEVYRAQMTPVLNLSTALTSDEIAVNNLRRELARRGWYYTQLKNGTEIYTVKPMIFNPDFDLSVFHILNKQGVE